jgi:hypothetical protein
MSAFQGWLWAFLFTQAVEVPIYVLGLRARFPEAFGASTITHPLVWFVIPPACERLYFALLAPHPALRFSEMERYWGMVVLAETFAILAEAGYFRLLHHRKALRWSLAANLASVTLGMACRYWLGFP